jgi:hypothetical protein
MVPLPPVATEVSPGGSQMYRYGERDREFELAIGDEQTIERISRHIEEHLGPVANVLHEVISDLVHIDVHVVEPTDERPFYTLVTSGMSDRPMTVPPQCEELRFAELMISLPADWPMTQEAFRQQDVYWPVRGLKFLARFPHEYQSWLSWGHTIPNGDPPEPLADNTELCCLLLLSPVHAPEGFNSLAIDHEKTVNFFSVIPLYREEMEYKLERGVEALVERFVEHEVTELLDIQRPNVCRRRKGR